MTSKLLQQAFNYYESLQYWRATKERIRQATAEKRRRTIAAKKAKEKSDAEPINDGEI